MISRHWDSYDCCDSYDSQVYTHRKNRRRLGCLGQYLQSRNDSDSSDHMVKIADRLGFLG